MFKRTLPRYREYMQRETYLELHAQHVEWQLDNPKIAVEDFADLWGQIVTDAIEEFESITHTEMYLLGRSGRHVCVADTPENSRRYGYLQRVALRLKEQCVAEFNSIEEV
jgi:hypothetical protein